MATQLEIIAQQQRLEHLSRNSYADNKAYSTTHENALSDWDEKGKGENVNSIGSSIDIQNRMASIARNTYSDKVFVHIK